MGLLSLVMTFVGISCICVLLRQTFRMAYLFIGELIA
jgi:hypothetical protein